VLLHQNKHDGDSNASAGTSAGNDKLRPLSAQEVCNALPPSFGAERILMYLELLTQKKILKQKYNSTKKCIVWTV
jgi:hypothetical protein